MKLLVTGGRGQLGRALCREARDRGLDVVSTDLPELDITRLSDVRARVAAERPDAIVNCAAYNAVDAAEEDFPAALLGNAVGPRNLALAAERAGILLVHFSTDYVFDGEKGEPYTIADDPRPLGAYGRSKLAGEREVRALAGRHLLVRLSWVFGPEGENFPAKVLRWCRDRASIRVVTDQVSSPSYAADLAPAVLDLMEAGEGGLFHMTNAGWCSRYEWAEEIVRAAGIPTRVEPATGDEFETPARRPAFSALDTFPLARVIGRELPYWKDATRRYLEAMGAAS